MNNTLKIALGVSGFAILLALTIPSNFNAPETKEEAQAPVQAAPVAPSSAPRPAAPVYDEEEEDSNFTFGKPTLDAKPYSQENDNSSDNNAIDEYQLARPRNSNSTTNVRPRATRAETNRQEIANRNPTGPIPPEGLPAGTVTPVP